MTVPPAHDVGVLSPPVAVVGDLHLSSHAPQIEGAFLAFLDAWPTDGGTLVLLGDVFDHWVGGAQEGEPDVVRVLSALRALDARGVRLAFLPGNRDFLFHGADGLTLDVWPDLVRTRFGERVVLLTHGDLLCTADHAYLRLRRVLRNRLFQAAFRRLPDGMTRSLARRLRAVSKGETRRKAPSTMGLDYGVAATWMQAHGADLLVAGHVHTGVTHRLPGDVPREVMVLKDWERGGSVVWFDGERAVHGPPNR